MLCTLEIGISRDADLEVAGAEMADLPDVARESLLERNGVRVDLDVDEQLVALRVHLEL